MKKILSVSVGRSDVGIYWPVWKAIEAHPDLSLEIILAGEHLAGGDGRAGAGPGGGADLAAAISREFRVVDAAPTLLAGDSPADIAHGMALGLIGFSRAYARLAPDWLLVLGDRYEMHAAALAATPFRIAIAHLHGGETTRGAIDEAYRHAITKYSHLHFVSTEAHRRRVIQLGEAPWRVTVSGAPALDHLRTIDRAPREELERLVGISLATPPLLATFHPVTLEHDQAAVQTEDLLEALDSFEGPLLISRPNADAGRAAVTARMEDYVRRRANARLHGGLGSRAWYSLMSMAAAMVGNSSSGIIEAASFGLPVVNVGLRQAGRARSANVIDVPHSAAEIRRGLKLALSPEFRQSLAGLENVYGDGRAAERIVATLAGAALDERMFLKEFHDLEPAP